MSGRVSMQMQYRCGGNYKRGGEVIFENRSNLALDEIDWRLRRAFEGGEFFVAEQVGLKVLYFDPENAVDEDLDHGFHEYLGVDKSSGDASDGRDIADFLNEVERCGVVGWQVAACRCF